MFFMTPLLFVTMCQQSQEWKLKIFFISNLDGTKLVSVISESDVSVIKIVEIGRRHNHSSNSEECCQVSCKKTGRYRIQGVQKEGPKVFGYYTAKKFLVAVEVFILTTNTLHLIKCIKVLQYITLKFILRWLNLNRNLSHIVFLGLHWPF